MQYKKSYFQGGGGVNEPTPQKKKYKSDKAIPVQPRFEEMLYHNYDLYNVKGKYGPGTGAYHMDQHKTVQEFLNKSRKKLKDKYKANNEETLFNTKKRRNKMKVRAHLLAKLTKVAIDFTIDDQIDSGYIGEYSSSYSDSVPIGGITDRYLPSPDFESKTVDKLNFGRDYEGTAEYDSETLELFKKFLNKYFNPKEPDLIGLSNGFEPEEDLDADKTVTRLNPEYGTTDSGNMAYQNMWFL